MEKVYVIVVDDVVEYESNYHAPKVFKDEKSAYDEVERLKRVADEFPNHWQIILDEKDCFESYPMGDYSANHYCVTMYKVDLL